MILSWIKYLFLSSARNLSRAPRRTGISLLAIAFATSALIVFQSFVDGVKTSFRHNVVHSGFGHYQVFKKGYQENKGHEPFAYPIENPEQIRTEVEGKVGKLALFSKRQEFFSLLSNGDRTIAAKGLGVDAEEEQKFLTITKPNTGTHLANSPNDSIYMGIGLAHQLGLKVGDMVTLVVNTSGGSLNAMDFTICGIFKSGITELDESRFFIHGATAQKLLRIEGFSQILLGFTDENELKYKDSLKNMTAAEFPKLEALHWHEIIGTYFDNSMGWVTSLFGVFRWIIILIASLSISNVFMMSVMERTGEFGTLRAIGTYRGEIAAQITTESLFQALLGSVMGILLSMLILKVFLAAGVLMPPPPNMSAAFLVHFDIPWKSIPEHALLCIAIAGGSGIFPAMKIARMNVVQALGRNI